MARPRKTTTKQADSEKVQETQEVKSPYVNEAAKEYFERTFPTKYKVHTGKALYKRTCTREGAQVPVSYVPMSVKVAPPKTQEYRYDVICTGGNNAKDIFNGADAQNYKAEKEQYLAKVNQAFEE